MRYAVTKGVMIRTDIRPMIVPKVCCNVKVVREGERRDMGKLKANTYYNFVGGGPKGFGFVLLVQGINVLHRCLLKLNVHG